MLGKEITKFDDEVCFCNTVSSEQKAAVLAAIEEEKQNLIAYFRPGTFLPQT
jgi:hypothetical protein